MVKFVYVSVREEEESKENARLTHAYICANEISYMKEITKPINTMVGKVVEKVIYKTEITMKNGDRFISDRSIHDIIEMICGE